MTKARPHTATTHKVVMLGFEQAQILDITGPLEVFARATRWLKDHQGVRPPAYDIELVAAQAGLLQTSGGLCLHAEREYAGVRSCDTLLIAGGIGYAAVLRDTRLVSWIRRQAGKVQRIGSVCTGALLLAAAGLLDGKRATTHWDYCERLARSAPRTDVEPDAIYVQDGNVFTSAGVTAGMDMALAMVEADWGKPTALAVAQELVMYFKRPGGQSQFSRQLSAQLRDDTFGELELWILDHLDADLSVESLARRAHMSARHFARLFAERMQATPASYVRRLRVEQARRRIENGNARFKQIARQCGFADEQAMRRAFRQTIGITPVEYHARFAG